MGNIYNFQTLSITNNSQTKMTKSMLLTNKITNGHLQINLNKKFKSKQPKNDMDC
jgi:hypothetical protein